jgi:hypothetical protein
MTIAYKQMHNKQGIWFVAKSPVYTSVAPYSAAKTLFVVYDNNLTAFVIATVGAHPVGQYLRAAVRASDQLRRPDGIVGAPAIAPSLANFSFWQRSHLRSPSKQTAIIVTKLY